MSLLRQAQIGDRCCVPLFSTLGHFLQCVLGLLEQAISNVVPSLLHTEDFHQPTGTSNVASSSEWKRWASTTRMLLICSLEHSSTWCTDRKRFMHGVQRCNHYPNSVPAFNTSRTIMCLMNFAPECHWLSVIHDGFCLLWMITLSRVFTLFSPGLMRAY